MLRKGYCQKQSRSCERSWLSSLRQLWRYGINIQVSITIFPWPMRDSIMYPFLFMFYIAFFKTHFDLTFCNCSFNYKVRLGDVSDSNSLECEVSFRCWLPSRYLMPCANVFRHCHYSTRGKADRRGSVPS